MKPSDIVVLLVAVLSTAAAISAQRQAAKANKTTNDTNRYNTEVSTRADVEKEAYMRARTMDVETIKRQDEEIKELQEQYKALDDKHERLKEEFETLKFVNKEMAAHIEQLEKKS